MKSPVFLLSLPRSGSTLLQRILVAHDQIASVSEPWFLLPIIYSQREQGVLAEYSHRNSQLGTNDLVNKLPLKQSDFDDAINKMATSVYEKLCLNNEVYFIDKTPRYHLIAKDLIRIFPEAKFIFLFRNPLDIFASTITTWGNNSFKKIYSTKNDFKNGFDNLVESRKMLGEKCLVVNYEELVSDSKSISKKITSFLNIEDTFNSNQKLIKLSGKMGDQVGVNKYKKINTSSIGNWKKIFNSPFRKKIINQFINSIDSSILKEMGYIKNELLESIDMHKVGYKLSIKDRWHLLFSNTAILLNGHLLFTDLYKWARKKYLS